MTSPGRAAGARLRGAWQRGAEPAWLVASAAAIVLIAVVDVSLPSRSNIAGALVLVPFLASGGARPWIVAGTGVVSAGCALGLAAVDGSDVGPSSARILAVLVGTVVAVQASRVRRRREQQLVDLTVIAETAQQAIIRRPPDRVGCCRVATWYQSATQAAQVGGDCFEVLDTSFGTRVLVGDVRGHGLPGVRLAARMVGGFRALAFMAPDLTEVAYEMDLLAARYAQDTADGGSGEEFVTAVLVEVKPEGLNVANCGHPAPVVVTSSGAVRSLDASAPAPPLGLGLGANRPTIDTFAFGAGERLLLYTDGLIEARDRRGRFFDLVAAASELAGPPLEEAVAGLIAALNAHASGTVTDDVALVAIERPS